ncbi:MAG: TIGR02444 family protein [Gammaproteobacteria bacterium]|nr:TIGR02444 family protein [Gammaproteobacteria bacterium]
MTSVKPDIEQLAEDLWAFSLEYYKCSEVETNCLQFQNEHHGNVNVLLVLLWYSIRWRRTISQSVVKELLTSIKNEVTLVDTVRTFRKNFEPKLREISDQLTEQVKPQFLAIELLLEKQMQMALVTCFNRIINLTECLPANDSIQLTDKQLLKETTEHNIEKYIATLNDDSKDALDLLKQFFVESFIEHLYSRKDI